LIVAARSAVRTDARAIAEIYNQGIADRVATFETRERTPADIETDLADRGSRHPTVVLQRDGEVVAVAWASPYRPRDCYAGIAEFSVYTLRSARRTGAGTVVLEELIRQCELRGFWKLVSRIFPENTCSLTLCRRLGFREVGVYRRHGRLDGVWRDCVIVEKLLRAAAEPLVIEPSRT
jgi:phosphinothricin acetyltransferase